jgi:uncharacterized protein (DUF433 family)
MASTSVLLTRREAAEIGRVPLNAIDKAIEQGVVKPKRKQGKPLLPAHEVALLVLLRQIDVALPTKAKQHLRKWLAGAQAQAVGSELALSEALRVAMTEDVAQTIERAESYARLRDCYVERNPAVMGGEPVIAGTRVPVRTIASLIEMGEKPEVLREDAHYGGGVLRISGSQCLSGWRCAPAGLENLSQSRRQEARLSVGESPD